MNKAEKYIKDYTRKCSNEMALRNKDGSKLYNAWLTPDDAKCAVEIAREEIYEWLEENAYKYSTVGLYTDAMITDLKQAMKDE